MEKIKKALVAPLDWGLGHATRSIPIIRELQANGCEVCIASSGDALALLKGEFPKLQFFELPSYQATYSKHWPLILKVLFQIPKFLNVIRKEHFEIEKIVKTLRIDFVFSDNRFGCWTKQVPCIFITHQVNIQMPLALKILQPIINFFNHAMIKKFSQCWVPDFPENRITGKMTDWGKLPVKFIGMLSRFNFSTAKIPYTYDYLALVSGPEPQRTVFEQKIRLCFSKLRGRKILVRGTPGYGESIIKLSEWDEVGHLKGIELQLLIEQSKLVISRSGYSTIMDLAALGKKAIFVPTPGQTEQEYLGEQLMRKKIAKCVSQNSFSEKDVVATDEFVGFVSGFSNQLIKNEMSAFLDSSNKCNFSGIKLAQQIS